MKRMLLLAAITIAASLAFAGVAFANFGTHGGYVADTDSCAGCHRAHTANSAIRSSLTWTSKTTSPSALLIIKPASNSAETKLTAFCYTCHSGKGGAATDVANGVYVSSTGAPTESVVGKGLNGGAFGPFGIDPGTGLPYQNPPNNQGHSMDKTGGTLFGSDPLRAVNAGTTLPFTCGTCHDPHGTSNYRLLSADPDKTDATTTTVGGYDASGNPTPYVVSSENNYPAGGFALHDAYWAVNDETPTATDYRPNYTTARYGNTGDTSKGITGWCIDCHERYATTDDTAAYNANDGAGSVPRHRHAMNLPLSEFPDAANKLVPNYSPKYWEAFSAPAVDIPLEHNPADPVVGTSQPIGASNSETVTGGGKTITVMKNKISDRIGCLTCHRAHGTATTMTGYASVLNAFSTTVFAGPDHVLGTADDISPSDPNTGDGIPSSKTGGPAISDPSTAPGGVSPAFGNTILRANNRGVCERCHNK